MTQTDKRIMVTGGEGFLGSHIVDALVQRDYKTVLVPKHSLYDLTYREDILRMFVDLEPDVVIHAAASVGGIGWNVENPAKALYDNLAMGLNLLEGSRMWRLEKFVQIGSVCAYPLNVSIPTQEDELWSGAPEPTNAPYGIAKRVLATACEAYRKQYGLNAICLMPVNLYGPRDKFNSSTSHVIAAMIRKFIEAKETGKNSVTFWGTGEVTREFLYVEDCANAIVLAMERYDKSEPVNLGSAYEMNISHLAHIIAAHCGYWGEIKWDANKPSGQPHRLFDVSKAEKEFGFKAQTTLADGLYTTVQWYKNYAKNNTRNT